MAMAVGSASDDDVISAINTTPLVDVMLVLLIIFLITIPVVTTSIPVQLPKERVEVRESKPENIIISVDTSGNIYWYDAKMPNTDALIAKLKNVSKMTPQPEVLIRGDVFSPSRSMGKILLACQRAGIMKVAFISESSPLCV